MLLVDFEEEDLGVWGCFANLSGLVGGDMALGVEI